MSHALAGTATVSLSYPNSISQTTTTFHNLMQKPPEWPRKQHRLQYHTKINAIPIIFQAVVVCTENLRHFCLWLTHSLITALLLKNVPKVFVGLSSSCLAS